MTLALLPQIIALRTNYNDYEDAKSQHNVANGTIYYVMDGRGLLGTMCMSFF